MSEIDLALKEFLGEELYNLLSPTEKLNLYIFLEKEGWNFENLRFFLKTINQEWPKTKLT